jgi:hypothetical protein
MIFRHRNSLRCSGRPRIPGIRRLDTPELSASRMVSVPSVFQKWSGGRRPQSRRG